MIVGGHGRDSGGGRGREDKGSHHCSHYGKNNHTTDKCKDKFGKPK